MFSSQATNMSRNDDHYDEFDVDSATTEIDNEFIDSSLNSSSNSDFESETNILAKKLKIATTSTYENDLIAKDGTVWKELFNDDHLGRAPIHNVIKEKIDPTEYANRNIMKGDMTSLFFYC